MSNAAIVKGFMAWLEAKDVCLAGPVFDRLLGTYELRVLAPEDVDKVIAEYLQDTKYDNLGDTL